tara:strand:- start:1568 stop:1759 length:192 start_codon:yes stop_codon:yes gene_type:complete
MKVGDIVRARSEFLFGPSSSSRRNGIVIDLYEDEYGIVYYEVHWSTEAEWWKEDELELISESW